MDGQIALIYSKRFGNFSYGEDHPFKILRYRLTYDLMEELGLLSDPAVTLVDCPSAPEDALLSFHRQDYLNVLMTYNDDGSGRANFRYGLGDVENPVFTGMYDWARLGCGGTIEAVRQVVDEGRRFSFNMAGGYHHAKSDRASGFCYLNDAVVAIKGLLRRGIRIAYVDIDAHHGDAVQEAFYDEKRVLTISLHESGKDFYPYSGFARELGSGKGYGYAVNIPFAPHSDDLIFEQAFRRVVLPLLRSYQPDLLVTQMGVDSLRTDPLTRLEMTTGMVEFVAKAFYDTGIPWVALGGGGYDKVNVARAWTLFFGTVLGKQLPENLPPNFTEVIARMGYDEKRLKDMPRLGHPDDFARAQTSLDRCVEFLERKLFPLHGIAPGV